MRRTYTEVPTRRPPAREPRKRRAAPPSSGAPRTNQVGLRARAWLSRNAWRTCLVVGWILVFALVVVPKTHDNVALIVELGAVSTSLLGFALGWIARGMGDGRDGR